MVSIVVVGAIFDGDGRRELYKYKIKVQNNKYIYRPFMDCYCIRNENKIRLENKKVLIKILVFQTLFFVRFTATGKLVKINNKQWNTKK